MRSKNLYIAAVCAGLLGGCAQMQQPGSTQIVKITPLGSHDGEFCSPGR
jgi:hypothetical protein